MLYDTLDEYDEAIAETQLAISRIKKIGQQHANNSGGTSRDTTEVELKSLREELAVLKRQRDDLDPNTRSALIIGAAW